MRSLLGEVLNALGKSSDQYIEIDIDPVSML